MMLVLELWEGPASHSLTDRSAVLLESCVHLLGEESYLCAKMSDISHVCKAPLSIFLFVN
jgi:hypothetical protein